MVSLKNLTCVASLPAALAAFASCTSAPADPFGGGLGGSTGVDATTSDDDGESSGDPETDSVSMSGASFDDSSSSGDATDSGQCMPGAVEACYSAAPATEGVGLCHEGMRTCEDGVFGTCVDEVVPAMEMCNGFDDDCDGGTDEDNPGGGQACATGEPGVCGAGTTNCVAGNVACERNVDPSPEVCFNAVDEDCDGQLDNGCTTCPFIYGHDGTTFRYETSAGGSSLIGHRGHLRRGHGKRVRFDPLWSRLDHAVVRGGVVRAKVLAAEDEIVYFDHAALTVVEHPAGHEVLSASARQGRCEQPEAFVAFETAALRPPVRALWRGRVDVTCEIGIKSDRAVAHDKAVRNFYELDFGARQARAPAYLVIDGWKYKERRKGLPRKRRGQPPRLQIETPEGAWKTVMRLATPRGDRKAIWFDVSHLPWAGERYRMRLWTGTHERGLAMWYVDRVRLTEQPPAPVSVRHVTPSRAALEFSGAPTMIDPEDHGHPRFNVDDGGGVLEAGHCTFGRFTRYGDVRKLLRKPDGRLVVMRRGDGVELRFDGVEPPAAGREQSLFLRTDLVFKPRIAPGAESAVGLTRRVGPLPHRDMERYESQAGKHRDRPRWVSRWNTRIYRPGDTHWGRASARRAA